VTREFIDHSVSSMGDVELLAALVDKERARRQLYAEELAVLAELDGRGVAGPLGYSDVAAIARELLRMNPAAARQQVAHARAVAGDTTPTGARLAPDLPRVAEAVADGTIGPEHVEAIRACVVKLPDCTSEARAGAEKILLAAALHCEPAAVVRLGREIHDRLDQDGAPPDDDELAHPHRSLDFRETRTGRLRGSFDLDAETGAQFQNLIGPLSKPTPTPEGEPHRGRSQRQGDAFAEMIQRAASATDRPTEAGEPVTLFLTTSAEKLAAGLGYGLLDGYLNLSIAQIRRLSCDCHVIPAVLGSEGELLDIGRRSRTVPLAIRRALIARDKGCAFPACERRAKHCQAHHIIHWVNGGPTALQNLVLLCPRHHRHIHHTEWEVRMNHGVPEFIPPSHIDSARRPRHNPIPRQRTRSPA
jgi:hypothetical protein